MSDYPDYFPQIKLSPFVGDPRKLYPNLWEIEKMEDSQENIRLKAKLQRYRRILLETLSTLQKDMTSKRLAAVRKKITEILMEE